MSRLNGTHIPVYIKVLLLRIAFALSILSLTWVCLYFYNLESFKNVVVLDWITGIWFDFGTHSLMLLLFTLLILLEVDCKSDIVTVIANKTRNQRCNFDLILNKTRVP